jgi:hypothetical protein
MPKAADSHHKNNKVCENAQRRRGVRSYLRDIGCRPNPGVPHGHRHHEPRTVSSARHAGSELCPAASGRGSGTGCPAPRRHRRHAAHPRLHRDAKRSVVPPPRPAGAADYRQPAAPGPQHRLPAGPPVRRARHVGGARGRPRAADRTGVGGCGAGRSRSPSAGAGRRRDRQRPQRARIGEARRRRWHAGCQPVPQPLLPLR